MLRNVLRGKNVSEKAQKKRVTYEDSKQMAAERQGLRCGGN